MLRRGWMTTLLAVKKYLAIDGSQRASALAFNALFAMAPLIILVFSIAGAFIDRAVAGEALPDFFHHYFPVNEEIKGFIRRTFFDLLDSRRGAGAAASTILIWVVLRFVSNLVRSTNRAWGIDSLGWWRLPLKSLVLLCVMSATVLIGIVFPLLVEAATRWIPPLRRLPLRAWQTGLLFLPSLFIFVGLLLFYKIAPRGRTRFAVVWIPALVATLLFRAGDALFFLYLKNFAPMNPVYSVFGGAAALLVWSHLSGCIFIFGACLCAAGSGMSSSIEQEDPP